MGQVTRDMGEVKRDIVSTQAKGDSPHHGQAVPWFRGKLSEQRSGAGSYSASGGGGAGCGLPSGRMPADHPVKPPGWSLHFRNSRIRRVYSLL